jgi:hypothetical protein
MSQWTMTRTPNVSRQTRLQPASPTQKRQPTKASALILSSLRPPSEPYKGVPEAFMDIVSLISTFRF